MLNIFRKREGFTLVELIVVIAVLLILMAIAIPAYLGVRDKAADTSDKADLTTAFKNAKVEWADDETWGSEDALLAALVAAEPGLVFTTAATADDDQIHVDVTGNVLTLYLNGLEVTGASNGTYSDNF